MNILKYQLYQIPGDSILVVPPHAIPLTVQIQNNEPVVWIKQPDTSASRQLRVRTVFTGFDVLENDDFHAYLGTFQRDGLVYHSFWSHI